ncbi:MAG: DNA repair protein RadC [Clostridia bacterium]
MENQIHEGHRKRMKEKVLAGGVKSLQPHEALEFMLYPFIPRKNTNDIAHRLIDEFGNFCNVLDADKQELMKVEGMTENASLYFTTLPQIFNAYSQCKNEDKPVLNTYKQAKDFFINLMKNMQVENVYLACLNSDQKLIHIKCMNTGVVNQSSVHIRSIAHEALKFNASGIILAHNHPSNNLNPSAQDIAFTKKLVITMQQLEIPVIDHLIVGADDVYSFKKEGKIDSFLSEYYSIV